MFVFPDILEGLEYSKNLDHENCFSISEFNLYMYLYILFVFDELININFYDTIVPLYLKIKTTDAYETSMCKIHDLILHICIIFIKLMTPFVEINVLIECFEILYVFSIENQNYANSIQKNQPLNLIKK